jgi:helicase
MEGEFLRDIGGFDLDWQFLPRFKTAKMFLDWINEKTEDYLLDSYSVAPGQLNQRQQIMEWLIYSASELCRLRKLKKSFVELKKLEARVEYGIREELLPLVSVKGIGRVRARKLFDAGVISPEKIKTKGLKELSKILGEKTAENVLKELFI